MPGVRKKIFGLKVGVSEGLKTKVCPLALCPPFWRIALKSKLSAIGSTGKDCFL